MTGEEKISMELVVKHYADLAKIERKETMPRATVLQLLGRLSDQRKIYDISEMTIQDWYESLNRHEVTVAESKEAYNILDSYTGFFSKALFLETVLIYRDEKTIRQKYVQLGPDTQYQAFREKYHESKKFRKFLQRAETDPNFVTKYEHSSGQSPQEYIKKKYLVLIPEPKETIHAA